MADRFVPELKDLAAAELERLEGLRVCSDCRHPKVLTEDFYPRSGGRGYESYCKKCAVARSAAYLAARPGLAREYQVKGHYGVSYRELFEKQGGVCAACGGTNPNGRALTVDHDHACCPDKRHSCGKCVRGLLCHNCNCALGYAGDDPERLVKLAEYLRSSRG